jgi:hypothetical protein
MLFDWSHASHDTKITGHGPLGFLKLSARTRKLGCCGGLGRKNPRLPDYTKSIYHILRILIRLKKWVKVLFSCQLRKS